VVRVFGEVVLDMSTVFYFEYLWDHWCVLPLTTRTLLYKSCSPNIPDAETAVPVHDRVDDKGKARGCRPFTKGRPRTVITNLTEQR
jgi:hypothetical protein